MFLEWQYLDGSPEEGAKESPTREDVASVLQSLDWNRFSSIQLTIDDENWLNGSGCDDADTGLSMMLSIDSIQHVSETAPDSPPTMLPALYEYLDGKLSGVLRLIYDADARGLSSDDIEKICQEERENQKP